MSDRLTFDMEGFKLLEERISKIVSLAKRLKEENLVAMEEVERLRREKEELEAKISELEKGIEVLNSYKEERAMIKNIIERIISKIEELGI